MFKHKPSYTLNKLTKLVIQLPLKGINNEII